LDFSLRRPEAAIPREEDAVSIAAAVIIRAQFAQDDRKEARGVVVLFDAMIGVLSGDERGHSLAARFLPRKPSAFVTQDGSNISERQDRSPIRGGSSGQTRQGLQFTATSQQGSQLRIRLLYKIKDSLSQRQP
jgi:hypothetical protein